MIMKSYFKLSEFITSDTAKKKGINNTPSLEIENHINEFINNLLNPLREAWGSSIIVSSGYRCPALNKAVGGVSNSSHLTGYAADLIPGNKKIKEFIKFTQEWIKDKQFDQCINEYDKWCHLGYKNNNGQQRKQIFKIG